MAKHKGSTTGAGTPAMRVLTEAGVDFEVHTFEADDRSRGGGRRSPGSSASRSSSSGRSSSSSSASSFGAEAADALGVEHDRVFKTLLADVDGRLWVAVVPVSTQLDLKSLASAAGGKRAAMAEPARAERSSGYVVGGISPLGQRTPLPTVVDDSVLSHPTVFVSGGRRGLDLELAGADLIRLTSARTAPIGSPPRAG